MLGCLSFQIFKSLYTPELKLLSSELLSTDALLSSDSELSALSADDPTDDSKLLLEDSVKIFTRTGDIGFHISFASRHIFMCRRTYTA